MRILVTGAAGFIGSHLCRRLVAQGHDVLALDDHSSGSPLNLAGLAGHPRFRQRRHDVTEPFDAEVDQIYHLACPASPVFYQRDPVQTTKTAVLGSLHALELARRTGARVLLSSTSEVYGDPSVHPQTESYWGNVNPVGPRSCYDEGKRCAETLFFDHHRQHGVAIKVARIFNTYGPAMRPDDGRVVSNFIVQALRGESLTVYGEGSQTRSFCYVDDLVEGLVRLMASPPDVTGPVNLGNPVETTMRELATTVLDLIGGDSSIVHRPLPVDDPVRRRPDITVAQDVLGWAPSVPLRDGLAATVDHFRRTLSTPADEPSAAPIGAVRAG